MECARRSAQHRVSFGMLAQSVRRALALRDDELSAQAQLADYVGGRVPASEQVRVIAFLRELLGLPVGPASPRRPIPPCWRRGWSRS